MQSGGARTGIENLCSRVSSSIQILVSTQTHELLGLMLFWEVVTSLRCPGYDAPRSDSRPGDSMPDSCPSVPSHDNSSSSSVLLQFSSWPGKNQALKPGIQTLITFQLTKTQRALPSLGLIPRKSMNLSNVNTES